MVRIAALAAVLLADAVHAQPGNPRAALPAVRRLIFDGAYREAADLIGESVMAEPLGQTPYQTVGSLLLEFPGAAAATGYRRNLDIESAAASVSYRLDGVTYRREIIASAPDDVIAVRPGW